MADLSVAKPCTTAHLDLRGGQVRKLLHRAASRVLAGSAEDRQHLERPLRQGGHVDFFVGGAPTIDPPRFLDF